MNIVLKNNFFFTQFKNEENLSNAVHKLSVNNNFFSKNELNVLSFIDSYAGGKGNLQTVTAIARKLKLNFNSCYQICNKLKNKGVLITNNAGAFISKRDLLLQLYKKHLNQVEDEKLKSFYQSC